MRFLRETKPGKQGGVGRAELDSWWRDFGSWLEEVTHPGGISSHTESHPASSLCFLAHHEVNLAAVPSETVSPNKALLSRLSPLVPYLSSLG